MGNDLAMSHYEQATMLFAPPSGPENTPPASSTTFMPSLSMVFN
jgi:hypothetical protein